MISLSEATSLCRLAACRSSSASTTARRSFRFFSFSFSATARSSRSILIAFSMSFASSSSSSFNCSARRLARSASARASRVSSAISRCLDANLDAAARAFVPRSSCLMAFISFAIVVLLTTRARSAASISRSRRFKSAVLNPSSDIVGVGGSCEALM